MKKGNIPILICYNKTSQNTNHLSCLKSYDIDKTNCNKIVKSREYLSKKVPLFPNFFFVKEKMYNKIETRNIFTTLPNNGTLNAKY